MDVAMRRFEGKVCLVTGAAQGIGLAVARRLLAEGGTVMLLDRDGAACENALAGLGEALRERGHVIEVDFLDPPAIRAAFQQVVDEYGVIDVLVNNIGGATSIRPFDTMDTEFVFAEIQRSLMPAVWGCHEVLVHLRRQGHGAVVNLGSTSPRGIYRVPYAVAKGGVFALTTALATELAEFGIRVNCVAPGATNVTDRVNPRPGFDDDGGEEAKHYLGELKTSFDRQIPMRRWGEPDEIAAAVAFMASDDASFITGQILPVAGGAQVP